jgi:hypothetical protein
LLLFLVCRLSSALGLEQPDDATEAPAPEPERAFDDVVLDIVAATIGDIQSLVLLEELTPISVEIGRTEIGAKDASPKMLAGEPSVLPPPMGSNLPIARVLTSCKVTGNPQQQPSP